jgi:hypothetical protein
VGRCTFVWVTPFLPPLLKKKQFAIITAWNPNNRELTLEDNRLRNNKLEEMIKLRAYIYYPSIGATPDHSEESFTVENISEADAVFLGSIIASNRALFFLMMPGDHALFGAL